jgi:hypothetical protein
MVYKFFASLDDPPLRRQRLFGLDVAACGQAPLSEGLTELQALGSSPAAARPVPRPYASILTESKSVTG